MKLRFSITALATAIIVLLGVTADGHHSVGSFYDISKTISITGVLKVMKVINPHSRIELEVTQPDGQKVMWIATTTSGTRLTLMGFTNDTIKVGSTVTLEGNPTRKEGVYSIVVNTAITPDGKKYNLRDAPQ